MLLSARRTKEACLRSLLTIGGDGEALVANLTVLELARSRSGLLVHVFGEVIVILLVLIVGIFALLLRLLGRFGFLDFVYGIFLRALAFLGLLFLFLCIGRRRCCGGLLRGLIGCALSSIFVLVGLLSASFVVVSDLGRGDVVRLAKVSGGASFVQPQSH